MPAHDAFLLEPATLEPVQYERVTNEDGELVGWAVPKRERRRWEKGSGYPGTGSIARAPVERDELEARPLEELVEELEGWGIGEERLYRQLGELYARKALIADRLTRAAVNGASTGSLHDPTAFLASRLRPKHDRT